MITNSCRFTFNTTMQRLLEEYLQLVIHHCSLNIGPLFMVFIFLKQVVHTDPGVLYNAILITNGVLNYYYFRLQIIFYST